MFLLDELFASFMFHEILFKTVIMYVPAQSPLGDVDSIGGRTKGRSCFMPFMPQSPMFMAPQGPETLRID